jgi:uncharacterized protein YcfJ
MSQPKPPTPNPSRDYKKSLQVYMKYLPQLLEGEQAARTKYDPARIEQQQALQAQYGPTQYAQQLAALKQLDPQGVAIRQQLGDTVTGNLAAANQGVLPRGLMEAWTSQARGSEVARGNVSGAAPTAFEDIFKGQNLLNYQQQQMQNAGAFLAGPTPEQQLLAVQPVAPDRASAYVNPSAPGQLAAPNYQNLLAQYQASGAGRNPWAGAAAGALGGALSGATIGSAVPGIGTAVGAIGGGLAGGVGGYFSDARKKNHIEYVGRSPKGHPIYEFAYDDVPDQRFRGTIAQELLATCPEACTLGEDGFWRVDYSKTDIKLEQVQEVYA